MIFLTNHKQYPYLLEITQFVQTSNNVNNFDGERQFRLLRTDFTATGDGYSLSDLDKSFPGHNIQRVDA